MSQIDEVWAREDSLLQALENGDSEKFKSFYADSFLGWPLDSPRPEDKEEIDRAIDELFKKEWRNVRMKRMGASNPLVNIVIVYYIVHALVTPGGEYSRRIGHFWQYKESVWQIIGGMDQSIEGVGAFLSESEK